MRRQCQVPEGVLESVGRLAQRDERPRSQVFSLELAGIEIALGDG